MHIKKAIILMSLIIILLCGVSAAGCISTQFSLDNTSNTAHPQHQGMDPRMGMSIAFTKLHGNGNDFVLIDEMKETVIPDELKPWFAETYCDRRFGIGGDGILFISPASDVRADVKMRLFQPDGSEAEMCGNGIRCLAKYAFDMGYVTTGLFNVETKAGILPVRCGYDEDGRYVASIEMGEPVYQESAEIASNMVYSVHTGVPHAVVFVDDLGTLDIDAEAPAIRYNPLYPDGTNVNFVEVTGKDTITVRTFERGVEGETLSCGTGSTASALISAREGKVSGDVIHVITKGGPLDITVSGTIPTMSGPAETVYSGEITY